MTDKGMSVGSFVQSLVTQWASKRGNDLGMARKRSQKERTGIEMKSKGPK